MQAIKYVNQNIDNFILIKKILCRSLTNITLVIVINSF